VLAECEGNVGALAEEKSAGEEKVQQQAKEQSRQAVLSRGRRPYRPYGAPKKRPNCPRPYRPVLRLFWADLSRPYRSFSWLSRG
jgi:hypothetical protein